MENPIIIQKLGHRGIKPTAMRILVLKTLLDQTFAISVSDLEMLLENADRITLFRTLKTFEKHSLVHRIDDGTGIMKYALSKEDECDREPEKFHIHFLCNECGKTYCILDSMIPSFKLPINFRMQEMNVVMKGICDNCFTKDNRRGN